MHIQQAI